MTKYKRKGKLVIKDTRSELDELMLNEALWANPQVQGDVEIREKNKLTLRQKLNLIRTGRIEG